MTATSDPSRALVIVNPRSGGGISESRWARVRGALADGLGEIDTVFTTAPRDAAVIAAREAQAGRRLMIALGGDGTIHEVADGLLSAGAGATTEIGLIPRGTGGDFRRTLVLPEEIAAAARHIRDAAARPIDAGRVRFRTDDGGEGVRHFINVASFGFSSAVANRTNSSSKRFGGRIAFLGATAARALRLRQRRRLALDRRRAAHPPPGAACRRRKRPLLRGRDEDLSRGPPRRRRPRAGHRR